MIRAVDLQPKDNNGLVSVALFNPAFTSSPKSQIVIFLPFLHDTLLLNVTCSLCSVIRTLRSVWERRPSMTETITYQIPQARCLEGSVCVCVFFLKKDYSYSVMSFSSLSL